MTDELPPVPACAQHPPEALLLCRDCPVRVQCLDDYFDWQSKTNRPFARHEGVIGGTTPRDRRRPQQARVLALVGRPEWSTT